MRGEVLLSTAVRCHWFPSAIPAALCLRPRTRCLHKCKLKFEELFIFYLQGFLQAGESAAIPQGPQHIGVGPLQIRQMLTLWTPTGGRREVVGACGCQRHMRCPGGAQMTWEGIYVPGVVSGKLGVKLPGKSMWCDRQRSKCKCSGDLRERGLARRRLSIFYAWACPNDGGFGFFPPCRSHHCPSSTPSSFPTLREPLSLLAPTIL